MTYFNSDIFDNFLNVGIAGMGTGFVIGFISWGVSFAIYSIIKWLKMA